MTRIERIVGVSRLPNRRRSRNTLAVTPEKETQVMPASATAAIGPHPRIRAHVAPGSALRRTSRMPALRDCFRLVMSSVGEYSNPSITSSRMTPSSLPQVKNSLPASSPGRVPTATMVPPAEIRSCSVNSPAAFFGDHIMASADSRQIDLLDSYAHAASPTGDPVASLGRGAIRPRETRQPQRRSIRR